MPQNTKDSKGGKSKAVKDTASSNAKPASQQHQTTKSGSVTGASQKGEKKTTP